MLCVTCGKPIRTVNQSFLLSEGLATELGKIHDTVYHPYVDRVHRETECRHIKKFKTMSLAQAVAVKFSSVILAYDDALVDFSELANEPALGEKFLRSVPYSEEAFRLGRASGVPFVLTGVPVQFDRGSIPSKDVLVGAVRACLGRKFYSADKKKSFQTEQLLLAWEKSEKKLSHKHELDNVIEGSASKFLDRFSGLPLITDRRHRSVFSLTLSPRGSVAQMHHDDVDGYVFYLHGQKLWFFLTPLSKLEAQNSPGIVNTVDAKAVGERQESELFSLEHFTKLDKTRAWWTVTGPGDFIWVPKRMWHRVLTLEPTLGITCCVRQKE